MPIQMKIPREALDPFCRSWKITELAFFGSVLREDFGEQSDIDILVTFASDATPSLFDMVTLEIIGEVARRVSEETKTGHPEIPWR